VESSTRQRLARVSIATLAIALAAATIASAAPSLDLSLPGAANRLPGDQTCAVDKATKSGRAHNVAAGGFAGIGLKAGGRR